MNNQPKSRAIPINGSKIGNKPLDMKAASPASAIFQEKSLLIPTLKVSGTPPDNNMSTLPKKKGGFVITGVKDDGDESADDLDVSHASYSDISYSRTTDVDHDQESTASEDTINIVLQSENVPQPTQIADQTKSQPAAVSLDQNKVATANALPKAHLKPQKSQDSICEATQAPTPAVVSTITTTAKNTTTTTTATPAKTALRNYKFVKRDTHNPVHRTKNRWNCIDYLDLHSPCYANLTQSASTLKIGPTDPQQLVNPVANSVSGPNYSIVASSSSYTLQHSDSSSSIQRDVQSTHIPTTMNPTLPLTIQQSASSSSVNYDTEARKAAGIKPSKLDDYKVTGDNLRADTTDTDSIKSFSAATPQAQWSSFSDYSVDGREERETQRSLRIENRIGQAMDLVKQHLTFSIGCEVAELFDRVHELQEDLIRTKMEFDILKSVAPADVVTLFHHKLNEYYAANPSMIKKATANTQPLYSQSLHQTKPPSNLGTAYAYPVPPNQSHLTGQQMTKSQMQQQTSGLQQVLQTNSAVAGAGVKTSAANPSNKPVPNPNRQLHHPQLQQQQVSTLASNTTQHQIQTNAQMHLQQLHHQKQQANQQKPPPQHPLILHQNKVLPSQHHQYQPPSQQQYQQPQVQYQQQKPPQLPMQQQLPTQKQQMQPAKQQLPSLLQSAYHQQPTQQKQYQQQPPQTQYQSQSVQQPVQYQQQLPASHFNQQQQPRLQQKLPQLQAGNQQMVNNIHVSRQPPLQSNNQPASKLQPTFYPNKMTSNTITTNSGDSQLLKQQPQQTTQQANFFNSASSNVTLHMQQQPAQPLHGQHSQITGGIQNTTSGPVSPTLVTTTEQSTQASNS